MLNHHMKHQSMRRKKMSHFEGHDLEWITKKIEELEQAKKHRLNQYDIEIAQLTERKQRVCANLQKEIDEAVVIQRQLMGNAELVETKSFVLTMKPVDLRKPSHFKLQPSKVKEEKEQFIQYLRNEHPELVKESTEYKPKQLDIKKLIADGVFQLTDDLRVIDENGCYIPNLTVGIKEPEVKVKVKQV